MDLSFLNIQAILKGEPSETNAERFEANRPSCSTSTPKSKSPIRKEQKRKKSKNSSINDSSIALDAHRLQHSNSIIIHQQNDLRFDKKRPKGLQKASLAYDKSVVVGSAADQEILCIQCPEDFDCQMLQNVEIPCSGSIDIPCSQSDTQSLYTMTVTDASLISKQAVVITGDTTTSQLRLVRKPQRSIIISKKIQVPLVAQRCFIRQTGAPELPSNLRQPQIFTSTGGRDSERMSTPAGSSSRNTSPDTGLSLDDRYDQFPKLEEIMPADVLRQYGIQTQQINEETVKKKKQKKEKKSKRKKHEMRTDVVIKQEDGVTTSSSVGPSDQVVAATAGVDVSQHTDSAKKKKRKKSKDNRVDREPAQTSVTADSNVDSHLQVDDSRLQNKLGKHKEKLKHKELEHVHVKSEPAWHPHPQVGSCSSSVSPNNPGKGKHKKKSKNKDLEHVRIKSEPETGCEEHHPTDTNTGTKRKLETPESSQHKKKRENKK